MAQRGRPKAELVLSEEERDILARWARRPKSPQSLALRTLQSDRFASSIRASAMFTSLKVVPERFTSMKLDPDRSAASALIVRLAPFT